MQVMNFPQKALDYMTDMPGWFAVNNGDVNTSGTDVLNVHRRMTTLRDAGQWVHIDLPLQAGLYAALILNSLLNAGVQVRPIPHRCIIHHTVDACLPCIQCCIVCTI
ncbi:MAG: hypothetical protein HC767_13645 [Akkermansiaceae bacterium]|nr:hypothetical protein [Akkermansiaceae bacterium]